MAKFLTLLLLLFHLSAFAGVSNITTTPLTNGSSYTGDWERVSNYSSVVVYALTDQDGTLTIQFSPDASNVDSSIPLDIDANTNEFHRVTVTRPYFRMVISNTSGSDQTFLRAGRIFGEHTAVTVFNNSTISQDADTVAVRNIPAEIDIPQGKYAGYSLVLKFGRNPDVDTATDPEDVWGGGGTYTGFPSETEAVEVLSSSANDDLGGSGAEKVRVYGLDANGLLQDEEVTLDGTTPVDTANTYSRVFRLIVTQSANGANTAFNAGTITARHTTTTDNVFATIQAGKNQSEVLCYTTPSDKTGYLLDYDVKVTSKASVDVDVALWVQETGKPPRLIVPGKATDTSPAVDNFYGGIQLSASTDICVRAVVVSANDTEVVGKMEIILVDD